ncbi:MAG: cyclic nucleotide-binding domain-containing protein [Proteobacteria bacterium]|nr:cyclic nucleotide-binding domain-containing protein [Pseudomonadota bacterium]
MMSMGEETLPANPAFFGRPPGLQKPVIDKSPEVSITFEAGDLVFSKGDPGGDLLFIDSGHIEIFIQNEKESVVLAQMGPGEIIGVMTFLTKDTRLASARATEPTVMKKIPSVHVQKHIMQFPKWLKIVLKVVGRINEMNRMYTESTIALKKARELQITPLFLATQMAQSLGVISGGPVQTGGTDRMVPFDELSQKMQLVLNQPKEMIEGLLRIFTECDLITPEPDPHKKGKSFKQSALVKSAIFTQFVRESIQGPTRKILKAKLTQSEIRVLKAICTFALKKGYPEENAGSLNVSDLLAQMHTITGVTFDPSCIERPAKLKLLSVKGEGAATVISITPGSVFKTMACVEAVRRLASDVDGMESPQNKEEVFEEVTAA